MKGYLWTHSGNAAVPPASTAHLSRSEGMAVDAVGNVIEFWGFKRNQGRVWALLYLRDAQMSASDIERELALSKGGVSMLLRDLERWGVVHRVRTVGDSAWRYRAETDLLVMARKVLEERELNFIAHVRSDLEEALRLAEGPEHASKAKLARLSKMLMLAEATERSVRAFLKTSRLDVTGLFHVLVGGRH